MSVIPLKMVEKRVFNQPVFAKRSKPVEISGNSILLHSKSTKKNIVFDSPLKE